MTIAVRVCHNESNICRYVSAGSIIENILRMQVASNTMRQSLYENSEKSPSYEHKI